MPESFLRSGGPKVGGYQRIKVRVGFPRVEARAPNFCGSKHKPQESEEPAGSQCGRPRSGRRQEANSGGN